MTNSEKESKRRANLTLIGAIILVAVDYGTYNILSHYIGELCGKLQADLTSVVLIFSIFSITSAICSFVSAYVINKWPMKIICLTGSIGFVLFFVFMYLAKTPMLLYIGSALFGVSNTFIGFTVLQPLITWWHTKNVGKKISMLAICLSLFAFVLSPLVTWLITNVGFETTILLNGLVLGGIAILVSIFMISDRPEKYGLAPYGSEQVQQEVSSEAQQAAPSAGGITVKKALSTYSFWAIIFAVVMIGMASTGLNNNASIVYQSMGLDLVQAGLVLSAYNVMGIFWNFIYGWLTDKIGPRRSNLVMGIFGTATFAIGIFAVAAGGSVNAYVIAILAGAGASVLGMVGALTLGTYFGGNALGTLIAYAAVASSIGVMIGPPLATKIYEISGSFSTFMIIGCALFVCALALLMTATSKKAVANIAEKAK